MIRFIEVVLIPKKPSFNPVIISFLTSIGIGLLVGSIKYLFDNVIGFSLIIIFPLLYGLLVGYVLSMLFSRFKLNNMKLAVVFAILSITTSIGFYIHLDRIYIEGIVLDQMAAEGEDVTDRYLTWEGYFQIIGELGTSIGYFGIRGIDITGIWYYGLVLFEFGLMYFYAVKNVREFLISKRIISY